MPSEELREDMRPGETEAHVLADLPLSVLYNCCADGEWKGDEQIADMMQSIAYNFAEEALTGLLLAPDDVQAACLSLRRIGNGDIRGDTRFLLRKSTGEERLAFVRQDTATSQLIVEDGGRRMLVLQDMLKRQKH